MCGNKAKISFEIEIFIFEEKVKGYLFLSITVDFHSYYFISSIFFKLELITANVIQQNKSAQPNR